MNKINRPILILLTLTVLAVLISSFGCSKERIVESTEYIENTEYIELPPDTVRVYQIDTVFSHDSVTVETIDTLLVEIHDTISMIDTVTINIYDTVTQVQQHYDTVVIIDTVETSTFAPTISEGFTALQNYSDPLVLDFVNTEFGLTDGWIYYLSILQSNIVETSTGVYNVTGYIDYWAPDWSGYYALEYYWQIRYNGGDPTDASNWTLGDPPAASPTHSPGIKLSTDASRTDRPVQP